MGAEYLRRWGVEFRRVGDMEEVLADPAVSAVIVAGRPGLGAERHCKKRRSITNVRSNQCRVDSRR